MDPSCGSSNKKTMKKIFAFETSRGVYTYIGGETEADALKNFPSMREARCVGEVPADEFFITTTTAPSVLYQREAKTIRRQRGSCREWYLQHGATLRR
jgi:hypothetical protein